MNHLGLSQPGDGFSCAALTHHGRRGRNEDSVLAHAAAGLFLVADGIGGAPGGDLASLLAVTTIRAATLRGLRCDHTPHERQQVLVGAIDAANTAILGQSRRTPILDGMGTTVAALLWGRDHVVLAHVGDSRIYRLRAGWLEQITGDHRRLGALTRCVGRRQRIQPDGWDARERGESGIEARALPVLPGDVFLLCSDGLSDVVPRAVLAEILETTPAAGLAAQSLLVAALERGASDNVTALVVRAGGDGDPTSLRATSPEEVTVDA